MMLGRRGPHAVLHAVCAQHRAAAAPAALALQHLPQRLPRPGMAPLSPTLPEP